MQDGERVASLQKNKNMEPIRLRRSIFFDSCSQSIHVRPNISRQHVTNNPYPGYVLCLFPTNVFFSNNIEVRSESTNNDNVDLSNNKMQQEQGSIVELPHPNGGGGGTHRRPQLRRRFSREEDGMSSEDVLDYLERRGSSLSELEIVAETISDEDVAEMERLLKHHHRAIHLTHIELPNNGLTAAAGGPLANIIQAQHETLTVLSLAHNPLTSAGLAPLVDALSSESSQSPSLLRELNLSDTKLGSKGAAVVASILRTNTSLRTLNLSKNDLGTKGIRVLASAIGSHGMLKHLDLSYNNMKPRGATVLAQALQESFSSQNNNHNRRRPSNCTDELNYDGDETPGLRSVVLTCNRIGPQGIQALCDVLKFDRTIESLSVGKNEASPEGGAFLAYLLKSNYTLRSLDVHDNQIGPDAASLLVEQLVEDNQTLERIDLSYNNIGQQGTSDLAETLMKNESLSECVLDGNQIDDEGVIYLVRALDYNHTLRSISLRHNQIQNDGAFAISNALGKSSSQIHINCDDNPIGSEGRSSLAHSSQLYRNRKNWLDSLLKGISRGDVSTIDIRGRNVADEEIILLSHALEKRWSPNSEVVSRTSTLTSTSSCSSMMSSALSLGSIADRHEYPIRMFHIDGANLTSRSLIPLIQATVPSSAKVLRLYFHNCPMNDPNIIEALSRCISLSTILEVFVMANCDLREDGAFVLSKGLRHNMTLRRLNLDHNDIGDRGMTALIEAIRKHPTLKSLSVAGNDITDACMVMSEGLMGLKELNLDDCKITDRGALQFLMGSSSTHDSDHDMNRCKLELVSLRRNNLTKRGGETIKAFLGDKATVSY